MNTIIIYYSYTNNTKNLALKIKDKLNCDIFELTPKKHYSTNYDDVVSEGQYEIDNDIRREINKMPDITKYNKIILLTPTWWYKPAPVITTYLNDIDLKNKTLIPAMTNAGWPGTVIKDMTNLAIKKGAKVKHPKEFKFDKDIMETSEEELNNWIDTIKGEE